MSELIVSVSGIRGVVGESLKPDVILNYLAAFAEQIPSGSVVIARDGRVTGEWISALVQAALQAAGRQVWDAGIAATPTVGRLVRQYSAAGGIQISASHNPPEYNGLKLFGSQGRVLPAELGQAIREAAEGGPQPWMPYTRSGHRKLIPDPVQDHLHAVLALVDVPRIRARGFRVLLDSNAGSGSVLGRRLLVELGCEVTTLGGDPTGDFLHPPEPTEENLQQVGQEVLRSRACVGFCQDPDADRLALIDARGAYIGEEYTLALCVDHVLRSQPGPVVTNCSTSRMTEDLCAKYGVPCYRSMVGEAHVADRMLEVNAVFGGEGNGGPIDPRVGYVRDSFVGMALILDALAQRQASLNDMVQALPRYYMVKTKTTLHREWVPQVYRDLQRNFADATVSDLDGLRWDWPERWLLIRPSNTEPIVRIMAEAQTHAAAKELTAEACGVIAASVRRQQGD